MSKSKDIIVTEDTLLSEARRVFKDSIKTHLTVCPCCDRPSKVYARSFYSAHARALIGLYWLDKKHPNDSFKIGRFADGITKHFAIVKFWGLAIDAQFEPEDNIDGQKRTTGLWKITENGRKFIENKLKITEKVILENNHLIAFEGEKIDVQGALGTKFNYQDLMNEMAFKRRALPS